MLHRSQQHAIAAGSILKVFSLHSARAGRAGAVRAYVTAALLCCIVLLCLRSLKPCTSSRAAGAPLPCTLLLTHSTARVGRTAGARRRARLPRRRHRRPQGAARACARGGGPPARGAHRGAAHAGAAAGQLKGAGRAAGSGAGAAGAGGADHAAPCGAGARLAGRRRRVPMTGSGSLGHRGGVQR